MCVLRFKTSAMATRGSILLKSTHRSGANAAMRGSMLVTQFRMIFSRWSRNCRRPNAQKPQK
eukprot:8054628-Pyramimonas_sp.AAC.1